MTRPAENVLGPLPLRARLRASERLAERWLWGARHRVRLADLAYATGLPGQLEGLAGRCVLVRASDPLFAALALVELDGLAARLVICPPDLDEADLPRVAAEAGVEAVVSNREPPPALAGLPHAVLTRPRWPLPPGGLGERDTEWVMFTSGTSGPPKMVVHTLAGLTGAIGPAAPGQTPPIWGTFYDIRRFGGLQILLRALTGEGSLALTAPGEPMVRFLGRLARRGATHVSGTPSHWRRLLMSARPRDFAPAYVRLSGEVCDQAVLDSLKEAFPVAAVAHAYASTEAGVGFEVTDGLEGFPATLVGRGGEPVEIAVADGVLKLRSARAASRYLGGPAVAGADGFVDTGDMVERRGERLHFVGRRGGVINVGGLKVHPEEVEAVINRHPAVRMSRVLGRKNPITGAIVVAEVVLDGDAGAGDGEAAVRGDILRACREALPPFKTPAQVRIVPALAMTAGGKMERVVA